MERRDDGWFEASLVCDAGARYRYRFADAIEVPDPCARSQQDGVHGWSVVVDPTRFFWTDDDWRGRPWEETILYELHVGLMGGFAGVEAELPRLKDLGVTAIELMPVNSFAGSRNWGYDGVLLYAPAACYGTPHDLKRLVDRAHNLDLTMFLDVVYNHFGPEGNYLGRYAPSMFHRDRATPWGVSIDFGQPEVRRFFEENARYWLEEYRFDGLRFDALHAVADQDWVAGLPARLRAARPDRQIHLVMEHDDNRSDHLRGGFDAQWNDDFHHVLHLLLSGEREGYYADYADEPARRLARCLESGFCYQGEASAHRKGRARGQDSRDLPSTAFVDFLQNHDQIGNRAMGDRLTALARPRALAAATALLLLSPHIPLVFMGEEIGSRTPFPFFADFEGALADAVRSGRRAEFAAFAAFNDPTLLERIPDPIAPATFEQARPTADPDTARATGAFYRYLLRCRQEAIVPRLRGTTSAGTEILGCAAVAARWRLGDGSLLQIAINLDERPVSCPDLPGEPLFLLGLSASDGRLPGDGFIAMLEKPR